MRSPTLVSHRAAKLSAIPFSASFSGRLRTAEHRYLATTAESVAIMTSMLLRSGAAASRRLDLFACRAASARTSSAADRIQSLRLAGVLPDNILILAAHDRSLLIPIPVRMSNIGQVHIVIAVVFRTQPLVEIIVPRGIL